MKKSFILIVIIFSTILASGQSGWLTNLKLAQVAAKNNNKLILIDFWATWCGPCKQMDADVWSKPEAALIKQNFIPVKIDIDVEQSLAGQYNVRSIPMLILMDYEGESILTYTGYKGKDDLMEFISKIPTDAKGLYEKVAAHDAKQESYQTTKDMGVAMQLLSTQTTYEPLVKAFLTQSDKYFKKSIKVSASEDEKREATLLVTLNNVYRGNSKKAIKEVTENMEEYSTEPTQALAYFILAKAYKAATDDVNYETYVAKLKEMESGTKYISMLE